MKKSNLILLIGFAVLVLLTMSFQLSVHRYIVKGKKEGIGAFIDQNRSLPPYSKIEISGNIKVLFTQEHKASLKVKAPESVMDSIMTMVKNNKLFIDKKVDIYGSDTITILISNPTLEELILNSKASLEGTNMISGDQLNLNMKGRSELTIQLTYNLINCTKEPESILNLQGDTRKINFLTTE